MSNATTLPLDPLFVKALRLLHSKSKDSTEQLKQMLDEAIANKLQAKNKPGSSDHEHSTTSLQKASCKLEEEKKKEAEKRNIEKIKNELDDLSSESKRPKTEKTQESSKDVKKAITEKERKESHRERDKDKEKQLIKAKEDSETTDTQSDGGDDGNIDADEFALGLGISCVVCRLFDVSSGNQLIECQECHNLYHQECHKPAVTEEEVNDPRFVWYCSQCSKSLKKMVTKPVKPKLTMSPTTTKDNETYVKSSKSATITNPFQIRRSEPKLSTAKESTHSSSAKPMSGFESLAANLSGRSLLETPTAKSKIEQLRQISKSKAETIKPSKSDTSSNSVKIDSNKDKSKGSGSVKSASNWTGSVAMAMNAEKKLQIVKKRAAANAKLSERKHYK